MKQCGDPTTTWMDWLQSKAGYELELLGLVSIFHYNMQFYCAGTDIYDHNVQGKLLWALCVCTYARRMVD